MSKYDYDEMGSLKEVVQIKDKLSLEFLYERLMLDGDARENWTAALEDLNLTLVIEESNV